MNNDPTPNAEEAAPTPTDARRLAAADGSGVVWKPTADELPPFDVPVWLYDAQSELGPYIGCRSDDADGWLWARCYDSHWWDSKEQCWKADAEFDDSQPTHWHPLPYPPNDKALPTPAATSTPD